MDREENFEDWLSKETKQFDKYIEIFNNKYELDERILKELFKQSDCDITIFARIVILNSQYGTFLFSNEEEKDNNKLSDIKHLDVRTMARYILENNEDIVKYLQNNDFNDAINKIMDVSYNGERQVYNLAYSFATKYCSWYCFANELRDKRTGEPIAFHIIDSNVCEVLYQKYRGKTYNELGLISNSDSKKVTRKTFEIKYSSQDEPVYINSCMLIEKLQNELQKETDYKSLDIFLWSVGNKWKNLKLQAKDPNKFYTNHER